MIYDEQIETQPMGDKRILDYLEAKNYHRCLDIGGVHRPWASKFVTTYVDMITFQEWKLRYPDMYESFPEVWNSKLILGDCEDENVGIPPEEVIPFIASGETVLTNSYHGAYWGLLLNRKVVVFNPMSSKFYVLPKNIALATPKTWQEARPTSSESFLNLCRNLNKEYHKRVLNLLEEYLEA